MTEMTAHHFVAVFCPHNLLWPVIYCPHLSGASWHVWETPTPSSWTIFWLWNLSNSWRVNLSTT